MFETLESRRLLAAPVVNVTARGAGAYEDGPTSRFFYVRRSGDTTQPLVVTYTVGGKATAGVDYNALGTAITIKPGYWLRRVEVKPVDDDVQEDNESVTLTLNTAPTYDLDPTRTAATIRIISNDEPAVPLPSNITWTTKAPNPIIRAEALREVVDGKLYVFGGFSGDLGPVQRSDVYDPATNTWTRIADLPTRVTHAGVAVDGHDVYVAGGYVGTAGKTGYEQTFGVTNVWKYNTDSNAWTSVKAMPKAMAGGGAVVIGRMLHYFGGDDSSRNDAGDHFVLDLDNIAAGWKTAAALPDSRSHFGTVLLDGKIYAIGGQHGNDAGLTTVTTVGRYDPATDQWTTLAPLPVAVSHFASAATTLNGHIIVLGGETDHEQPTNRVTLYDPLSNVWKDLTPLPAARFSGVAAAIGDVIYFTTGSSTTTTWKGVLS